MTDETIQSLKDDIAFMRALAQEGSSVPLLFGGNLVAAGLIFGAAAVAHWLISSGTVVAPDWMLMVVWLGAGAVFGVVCWAVVQRAKGRPGFNTSVNRATGAAWSGIGFAIFAMWLGLTAYAMRTHNWEVMNVLPTLILALYGAAWSVAAAMSSKRWLQLVAWGSYAGAVVMGAFTGSDAQMLAYAGCLLLLAVLPGWLLMRQEPADIV
jgi:hypothetical protein